MLQNQSEPPIGEGQRDGILVPPEEVEGLAGAMDRLMLDEAKRRQLASREVEVTEWFGVEKAMEMWEAGLEQILEGTHEVSTQKKLVALVGVSKTNRLSTKAGAQHRFKVWCFLRRTGSSLSS